ncbi:MAG: tetratricopeptide repeat protein [Oscillospiraceae bacterium]|nr:tetratricopeptide repeat protein [Oscillospiraceae bacterium]
MHYEKSLKIYKKIFGEEDTNVAIGYKAIGSTYSDKNEYDKALDYCFKALEILKKFLYEEDYDTKYTYMYIQIEHALRVTMMAKLLFM